jgi:hypothetical protein
MRFRREGRPSPRTPAKLRNCGYDRIGLIGVDKVARARTLQKLSVRNPRREDAAILHRNELI